jgi:uncharacterized SAM-binding protein YcdF (DUF218 family)
MIQKLFALLMILALMIAAAFAWFIETIPSVAAATQIKTDAIIVLTGGNGRVEQGLIALANGDAPVLFISGAGQHVTRAQMVAAHATRGVRARIAENDSEIVLDYVASTTRSNADQATEFVKARGIRSIRLVTANYHMPRSMLEFRIQMPGIKIVPEPVFPEGFHPHSWWRDKPTRRLVFSEFGKYFAALFLRTRFMDQ